jgi:hypothetical protein
MEEKPITIFVIYHNTFEDQNIFTTNRDKIQDIIKQKTEEIRNSGITDIKISDWNYREIIEEQSFGANMSLF